MSSTLTSEAVALVLGRLHATADREDEQAKQRVRTREAEMGIRLGPEQRYELYGDAPLAIAREVGEFYYLLAMAGKARNIVEFGTSYGISTIYLAAGICDGGGGSLITTEILPSKVTLARQNLRDAGLAHLVEIRLGDALQTLQGVTHEVDLLVLDGRNDQYLAVLDLMQPRLAPNALVIADLGRNDPDLLDYQRHVRHPDRGFFSIELPLDAGIEVSAKIQAPERSDPR